MQQQIPLVCVTGPTASGKTRLAVELALRFGGEVVSADSMQIYRGMDIGTAKPTREETRGIPHHCIDIVQAGAAFSVAEYVVLAHTAIADIAGRGRLPILAGGTGLYVSSICDNIAFAPMPSDPSLRAELENAAKQYGNLFVWEQLNQVDPALAVTLHPNNAGRVIRALEVFRLTGITMTEHQRRSRLVPSPYHLCMLGLDFTDRNDLYARIDARVEQMLCGGLLEEVRALKAQGCSATSAQAIGYKEFFTYLDGGITLAEAADNVKRESRRYAKRQLTWFRRDARIHWLMLEKNIEFDTIVEKAAQLVRESNCREG